MALQRSQEQRAIIAQADAIKRAERQEQARGRRDSKKALAAARKEAPMQGQRDPRQVDEAFISWLHVDIPCIACRIEGPGPVGYASIEAAHQKQAIAAKGWAKGGLGPRVHDAGRTCPLCSWHHRLARNSCDTGGQAKFWIRLGIGDDVADFCRDLFTAFRQGEPGDQVVRSYAAAGRTQLASPNDSATAVRSET